MRVVTAAEMRELDRRTIELGTPGLELMERAGASVASEILARFAPAIRRGVLVIAGRGNNGGDGFVIARLLRARGTKVAVALLGERAAVGGDARTNLDRWIRGRGRLIEISGEDDLPALERAIGRAGAIVDAILGTGLEAEVRGIAAAVIRAVNRSSEAAGAAIEVSPQLHGAAM